MFPFGGKHEWRVLVTFLLTSPCLGPPCFSLTSSYKPQECSPSLWSWSRPCWWTALSARLTKQPLGIKPLSAAVVLVRSPCLWTALVWDAKDLLQSAPRLPAWKVAQLPPGDFCCSGNNEAQLCFWNRWSSQDTVSLTSLIPVTMRRFVRT